MDWFLVFLSVAVGLWGVAEFVEERTIRVIAGICGIIAGVIGLVRIFS